MRDADFSIEGAHWGIVSKYIGESFVVDLQSVDESKLESVLKVSG
jgi:hypothetical protein